MKTIRLLIFLPIIFLLVLSCFVDFFYKSNNISYLNFGYLHKSKILTVQNLFGDCTECPTGSEFRELVISSVLFC